MKGIFLGACLIGALGAGGAPLTLSNRYFAVKLDGKTGGVASLVLAADKEKMNWVEGSSVWGEAFGYSAHDRLNPRKFEFTGFARKEEKIVSNYRFGKTLELKVERRAGEDFLEERYVVKNVSRFPVYFQRGHLGMLATFNDNYTGADVCEKRRCHAHLWPYGECAFVHAKKMGPFPVELALVMTEGALDGYSVRRVAAEYSNDRGDFVLHPAPFELLSGEERAFSWKIVAFPEGDFQKTLVQNGSAAIEMKHETVFPGEDFEISVTGPDAKTVRHVLKADRGEGEYPFWFDVGGKKAFARGRASRAFKDIVERRVSFIVSKQQCLDERSPLYGAYLIYDNEEKRQYFDEVWCDHNACRERLGMAVLIARYLRKNDDPAARKSLELFEKFVSREFFDEKTGAVFNTVGKDPSFKRLYNAPWMVTFFSELYGLKGEGKYLDWIERAILDYYAKGGARFYPNGCTFTDAIVLLSGAGRDVARLKAAVRRHVDNLVANSIVYPPHEVKFEQTIATPPVAILSDWCVNVEKSASACEELKKMVDVLERFDGDQPDHRLNSLPIRHWDAMWFGKNRLYGDTHHYWSVLSGNAYLLYWRLTGKERYRRRAEKCFRNCLWPYFADGSASAAYVHPFSVTMLERDGRQIGSTLYAECFDAFANDQDYALYFILRSGLL